MNLDHDFVLKVQEFERFQLCAVEFSSELEKALDTYVIILDNMTEYGVPSGQVHDALAALYEYVVKLKEEATGIGNQMKSKISDFITTVEHTDQILYDAGSKTTRDYSQKEFERLNRFLSKPLIIAVMDSTMNWYTFLVEKVRGIVTYVLEKFSAQFKLINEMALQVNKAAKAELEKLFENEVANDSAYGSAFSKIVDAMMTVSKITEEIDALILLGNDLTVETVNLKLSPLYEELSAVCGQILEIRTVSSVPTTIEIGSFAGHPWSDAYFNGCVSIVSEFLGSMDFLDETWMVLYNAKNLTKETVLGILTQSGYKPEEYKTRLLLLEQLNTVAETDLYKGGSTDSEVEDFRALLGLFKKYGNDYYKYANVIRLNDGSLVLDGRTIDAKTLKKFNNMLGNADDILKYGDEIIDYIDRYLADYSKGLAILESFEKNYGNDGVISRQIADIKALYQRDSEAWLKEAARLIAEGGYDKVVGELQKKTFKDFTQFEIEAARIGIESYSDLSGHGKIGQALYDVTCYSEIFSAELRAYQSAIQKLRDADPNAEKYPILAEDAKNCFELVKSVAAKMFESMEDASSSEYRKRYYRYCQQQVSKASMFDDHPLEFLSFEQYQLCA
ncbi:MAG: hypothetical protein K5756_07160 [Clostridiales bacterium]|nr:hypothetical protein [Clostridiales bacterium]